MTETELDQADVREALRSSLEAGGWIDSNRDAAFADAVVQECLEDVQRVLPLPGRDRRATPAHQVLRWQVHPVTKAAVLPQSDRATVAGITVIDPAR